MGMRWGGHVVRRTVIRHGDDRCPGGFSPRARGLAILFLALVLGARPAFAAGPASVADLAEGLLDSVVNISTSQIVEGTRGMPVPQTPDGLPFQEFFNDFFKKPKTGEEAEPPKRRVQSLGSGFVIDAAGIIITNNHVIEDADEITVNFSDGSKLTATLLGKDEKADLAVLQVKPNPAHPLKALRFGDSDKMRVGDWVMAIGNPFGLGGTVTVGIVSARNRDINSGPYDNFIQTDAAINRGNSGGPLFNMDGAVIGINTAIISPSGGSIGIGFAIPSDAAVHVVDQLRQFGETRRGWIGVRIQPVSDEIAASLSMGTARGALVAGLNEGGPAAEAKIEPGDVIVSFNGKPVAEMRDLPRLVADATIDSLVDVVVVRKGVELPLKLKVGRLVEASDEAGGSATPGAPSGPPASAAPDAAAPDAAPSQKERSGSGAENAPAAGEERSAEADTALGLVFALLDDDARARYSIIKDVSGVVVKAVQPGSSAAEKGIVAGEVVVEIAQEPVTKPQDIAARIAALKKSGRRTAQLLVASPTGELRFVSLSILDETP